MQILALLSGSDSETRIQRESLSLTTPSLRPVASFYIPGAVDRFRWFQYLCNAAWEA